MDAKDKALKAMLARLAHKLCHAVDREKGSILSTVARTLAALDTPQVAAVTGHSTFDASEPAGEKVTVYVVLRPEQLKEKAGLARAWLQALLWGSVRRGTSAAAVHYVLDEYAALAGGGRFQCVEDAITQYRKYGVRLHFYLQGVGQLTQCFGEGMDKTFLANVTAVFMGVNDLDTATFISDRCGQTTVMAQQESDGDNRSDSTDSQGGFSYSRGSNRGRSASETQRPLLTAGEVCALGDRVAVTFAPNLPPLLTRPVRFFEPEFRSAPGSRPGRVGTADWLRCLAVAAAGLAAGCASLWAAAKAYGLLA